MDARNVTSYGLGSQLADHEPEEDAFRRKRRACRQACDERRGKLVTPKSQQLDAPLPGDALPVGVCRRCGFVGEHASAADCIDNFRGLVADLQFRLAKRAA